MPTTAKQQKPKSQASNPKTASTNNTPPEKSKGYIKRFGESTADAVGTGLYVATVSAISILGAGLALRGLKKVGVIDHQPEDNGQ